MSANHSDKQIQLSLTADEAVVLFEFVRRFSELDTLTIADQAEERVLWNVCCIFEKGLLASLEGNWTDLLKQARNRLRDQD
jgi:hypothetical protein